jgi:hypothetical protein
MGKTYSKPLAARHAMRESAFTMSFADWQESSPHLIFFLIILMEQFLTVYDIN